MLALQGQTNRLLRQIMERLEDYPAPPSLYPVTEKLAALEQELTTVRKSVSAMEQAGRKRERRFSWPKVSLPRIRLPRPSWGWLFLPLALAALWVIWHEWNALWTTLTTWLG